MRGIQRQAEQIAYVDSEVQQYADTRREASVPPEEDVAAFLTRPGIQAGMHVAEER